MTSAPRCSTMRRLKFNFGISGVRGASPCKRTDRSFPVEGLICTIPGETSRELKPSFHLEARFSRETLQAYLVVLALSKDLTLDAGP